MDRYRLKFSAAGGSNECLRNGGEKRCRSAVCGRCGILGVGSGALRHAAGRGKERARVVLAQALPKMDGEHLKATLVEVNYGPGESSEPHSHPCPVIGYVLAGALRTQVRGEKEAVYTAGESFYEPANGVHAVSANASQTEPAKLLAYFVCDHDAALSVAVPGGK